MGIDRTHNRHPNVFWIPHRKALTIQAKNNSINFRNKLWVYMGI
jgi:hypothetical protein